MATTEAPPRWSTSSREESSTSNKSGSLDLPSLLPLSHTHPLLTAENTDWNVDEFLLSRLHVPLEELRGELREYLGGLKEELGGLINDDYEEFISLGLGLRGEGRRLESLRYPLEALKVEVEHIQTGLVSSQTTLQAKLDERSSLRSERAILDMLVHLEECLSRTEGLLGISRGKGLNGLAGGINGDEDEDNSDDDEVEAGPSMGSRRPKLSVNVNIDAGEAKDLKTTVRIANEYNQVVYLMEKARVEECEYVTSQEGGIESRIKTIKEALFTNLGRILVDTLKPGPSSSSVSGGRSATSRSKLAEEKKGNLNTCLEVYASIGGWREAEVVVRKVVREDVQKLIGARHLTMAPTPSIPQTPFSLKDNPLSPAVVAPATPLTLTSATSPSAATATTSTSNVFEMTLQATEEEAEDSELELLDESQGAIPVMLNGVLRYIEKNYLEFLRLAEKLRDKQGKKGVNGNAEEGGIDSTVNETEGEKNFEFMANSIWVEVGEKIMEEIGGVLFAAGRVSELHKNYTITHKFLDQLEILASSIPAIIAFRSTETYQTFEKRWQLPVYFQLQWKEIVKGFEEGLHIGQAGIGSEQGRDGYALPQSAATMVAFNACWAPDVYIPELAYRFWRLSLQVISRYRAFLESAIPALYDPANLPSTSQQPATRNSLNISRSSLTMTGPSLPIGDPSSDPQAAHAEDQILKIASLIAADLSRMHKALSGMWEEKLERLLLRVLTKEETKRLETTLNHSLAGLSGLFTAPSTHIISILIRRCTTPLPLVRSVASQLRNAPANQGKDDVKPSQFVGNVLKPLREYFGRGGYGEDLRAEVGGAWSRKVVEEVVAGYTSILVNVQRIEDTLRRARKGKKSGWSLLGGSNANNAASIEEEEERFKQQMLVDIRTVAKDAEGLGVAINEGGEDELTGWRELIEVAEKSGQSVTAGVGAGTA